MKVDLGKLLETAAGRHGVVTVAQMDALGITPSQRRRLVAAGALVRLLDGAYRIGGAQATEAARCVAASSRGFVVCGPTAGRVWQARRVGRQGLVWVLAASASNPSRASWLRPYRTVAIHDWNLEVIEGTDGITVTSPPRTALDLARHLSATDLRSVIDQFIAEDRCLAVTMRRVAEPYAELRLPWVRRFLGILDQLPDGRAPESHNESRVVAGLIARGVPGVRPQTWLIVPELGRIRLDAAVPAVRWGVEIDVHPDHFTESGVTRDHLRDLACEAIDWRIRRVTRPMLDSQFDVTIGLLVASYRARVAELAARDER